MWGKKKKLKQESSQPKNTYPIEDVPLNQIKKAIQEYSTHLPEKVPLSVIINDDLTINYHLIAPVLKAIPQQTYYMSRETYEVFDEKDQQLAKDMDMVQRAVDEYMNQTSELPIINGNPHKKVSIHKLEKLNLIDYRPVHNFYITNEEYLVTYKLPG